MKFIIVWMTTKIIPLRTNNLYYKAKMFEFSFDHPVHSFENKFYLKKIKIRRIYLLIISSEGNGICE